MEAESEAGNPSHTPIRRWLWLSYLRAAIVPLLFIEITFLAIFLLSNSIVHDANIEALEDVSGSYLDSVARLEAQGIATTLEGISSSTAVFASQTRVALDGNYRPSAEEMARYARTSDGGFYTRYGIGTTASYYTGATPVGPAEIEKVWKLAALDPLMADLDHANPLVASVYVNTFDSYNRIYPYFDVLEQYPHKMRIPDFNFYYLADAKHNPARKPVWTEAYLDPAGHGWMISSIAPVYRNGKLEAVVGQDLTLGNIISHLLNLKMPWNAYAMLVDRDGRIIAMPKQGETDLGLRELTSFKYSDSVRADMRKPEAFDLNKLPATKALAAAMKTSDHGRMRLPINGSSVASYAQIAGPQWRLVVIAPQANIIAEADALRDQLRTIGWSMAGALVVFYLGFFIFLYRRAKVMSTGLSGPIGKLVAVLDRIAGGHYHHEVPSTKIAELDELGQRLVLTGEKLGEAHRRLADQQRLTEQALRRQQQASVEQMRFIRILSHEIRTPLSVIDSGAQILEMKAGGIGEADLRKRATRFRSAVERITGLLSKLGRSLDAGSEGPELVMASAAPLDDIVSALTAEIVPADRLRLEADVENAIVRDSGAISLALRSVLDNAVRYCPEGAITVRAVATQDTGTITVSDEGGGVSPVELGLIGTKFFRGNNAANQPGAGVGLFLARRVLESGGGSLILESGAGGTTVTLTFQVTTQADESPEVSAHA
ncbi:sensor histidine kinase [Novosphingobium jiangmenense]|uniref:histidine kinase n=1 Tax=Novosphingobium jiangmenense TaxID=2791981 RepID=A0ABS0HBM8_9SPHN|nr:sensor histidine kinase [Novosphingobium jiangmenense]MBF9149687.1 sensor histidine kinase [Novosphingobium jiangmenense]